MGKRILNDLKRDGKYTQIQKKKKKRGEGNKQFTNKSHTGFSEPPGHPHALLSVWAIKNKSHSFYLAGGRLAVFPWRIYSTSTVSPLLLPK